MLHALAGVGKSTKNAAEYKGGRPEHSLQSLVVGLFQVPVTVTFSLFGCT